MRVIVLILLAFAILWLILGFAARATVDRALEKPWPEHLGTIRDAPRRYHTRAQMTPEAKTLVQMAKTIDVNIEPMHEEDPSMAGDLDRSFSAFDEEQLHKPDDSIDAPPPDVDQFLREHEAQLAAVTQFLNQHGAAIEWRDNSDPIENPRPHLGGYSLLARMLAAHALVNARSADPAAWDDTRAIYMLAKSLWQRSDSPSIDVAIFASRVANGVARKLPPPVPAWWRELDAIDARHIVIAAHQEDAFKWSNWTDAAMHRGLVTRMIFSPFFNASHAAFLNRRRMTAEEFSAMRNCGADAVKITRKAETQNWNVFFGFTGSGAAREFPHARIFDFERDAAERVLAIKSHQPLPSTSRCADGVWSHAHGVLEFSAPLPSEQSLEVAVPRTLRY